MKNRHRTFGFETLEDRCLLAVQPFPTPLDPAAPAGSLVYAGTTTAAIDAAGEVESFTISLDGSQRLSLIVDPDATLAPSIEVLDASATPVGATAAGAAGDSAVLQTVEIATPGTYTISVTGAGGTVGAFSLAALLNSSVEEETHGGASNDDLASAEDLDGSFIALGASGAARGAVAGHGDAGASDVYRFTLASGQSTTLALDASAGAGGALELRDAAGTLLTTGLAGANDASIRNLVAPATGAYYATVTGVSGDYSLVITRDADLDSEPNNSVSAAAQDLTLSGRALGAIASGIILPSGAGTPVAAPITIPGTPLSLGFSADGSFVSSTLGAVHEGVEYLRHGNYLATYTVALGGAMYTNASPSTSHGTDFAVTLETLSSGSHHVVRVRGAVIPGVLYERVVAWRDGDHHAVISTSLTNDTGAPLGNVAILENMDPDPGGTTSTANDVTAGGELVVASNARGAMALGAADPRAVVSAESFFVENPFDVINSPNDPNNASSDIAINLAFDLGTLAPGATETTASILVFGHNAAEVEATYAAVRGEAEAGDVDTYRISSKAGDVLTISTTIPGAEAGEFVNNLDAMVELYDPQGALVASDPSGALTHVAAISGDYVVRLLAEGTTHGEYFLDVAGHTGDLAALAVETSSIADGAALTAAPTVVTIDLSDAALLSSVDASDLTVNLIPAANVTIVDHDTFAFELPPLPDGANVLEIASGAIVDLQGRPIDAFSVAFEIDTTAPRVVASSILEGDAVVAGDLVYTAQFDDLLDATAIDASDVLLTGLLTGSHAPASLSYDDATSTLTVQYAGLPEDRFELTLLSGGGALVDPAGRGLDGEPDAATTVPSGDGAAGGNFIVNFSTDFTSTPFPNSWTAIEPLGSLVYDSTVSGVIGAAGDSDNFTVELDEGQTVTVIVEPDAALKAHASVHGPDGVEIDAATAVAAGDDVVIQTAPATTAGVYTVAVTGVGPTTGGYSVRVLLNAAIEAETYDGVSNDDLTSAEDLDGSFHALGAGDAARAAVVGRGDGGAGDTYRFTMTAGQTATVVVDSQLPDSPQLELRDAAGALLATSRAGDNVDAAIRNFVAPTSGAYFVAVVGAAGDYSLVALRDADFDAESNNALAPAAQDLTLGGTALGHIGALNLGGDDGVIKVGVLNSISSTVRFQLIGAGMDATSITAPQIQTGALLADNYDVLVLGRVYTGAVAQGFVDAVVDFVNAGGGLVTEWEGAALLFDGYHPTFRYSSANPQGRLLAGEIGAGQSLAGGTPISNIIGHPLWDGLPTQFSAGGGTEFFYTIYGYDPGEIEVIATFQGNGTANFPAQAFPAVFAARDFNIVGMPFDWSDAPADPNLLQLYTNAIRYVDGGAGGADAYSVNALAGDELTVTTSTPGGGPGQFVNDLDLTIELYDPAGNLVASDPAGALTHMAAVSGAYTVRILSEAGSQGEYVVRVSGHTGELEPFNISASSLPDGSALTVAPTEVTIDLSDDALLSTIDASDLTLDGVPLANVTIVDQDTLSFELPTLADGLHTLEIAAGAIVDLQGQPLEAFSSQFELDATAPRVIAASIAEAGQLEVGARTFTFTFDDVLDETTLDPADVQLTGLLSGSYAPDSFAYDAASSTLTLHYANLPEDDFTLRLTSSGSGFRDTAGNWLDGEIHPATTVPSGDGVPGGNFVVNFVVETTIAEFPVPFAPGGPLGSLVYDSTAAGRISPSSDVDEFAVELDAGQRLTIIAAADFQATLTLLGPDSGPLASASAGAPGDGVLLQGVPVDAAGTYSVRIESLSGIGDYELKALLNAVVEGEEHAGAANDDPASAEDLDGAFTTLVPGSSIQHAAVFGNVAGGATGVLFEDTFPAISFDSSKWSLVSGATIDGVGIGEPSLPYSARFNGSPSGGDRIESVPINLAGRSEATLTYWFQQTGGGETVDSGEDLIVYYQNATGSWVQIDRQSGSGPSMTTYQYRELVLPAAALHENFRLRFTNLATTGNYDDWFVDDVAIVGEVVEPDAGDWYRFSLDDGQSASIAVLAEAGPVAIALYDATGTTLLATGSEDVDWSQVIQNFVDQTSDGAADGYLLQIIGDDLDYQIAITRNAALDAGPNDSFEGAQDIGDIGAALGYAGAGDEDWYQFGVNAGDELTFGVVAPGGGPYQFVNPMGEGRPGGLVLSEVVDGTLADGNPKFIEITNTGAADYTFAAGGLIVQTNDSVDRVVDVDLTGVTIAAGGSFVIAAEANDGQAAFESTYGFAADLYAAEFLGDGNDRYILTDAADGSSIVDIYGQLDVNGAGQPWEYADSYAYRLPLATTPLGAAFDASAWFIAGIDALETGDDATELDLLRSVTAPAVHDFLPANSPLLRIELYDPTGALVSADATAENHLATMTGEYRVRVSAFEYSGEYVATVAGATGQNLPPQVVATDPVDGALFNQFPATFQVTFSEPLLEGAVEAVDLLINGVPGAVSVVQSDPWTFVFDLAHAANTGDGVYTVELPAGAVVDLSGRANEPFAATFTYDATGPVVLDVTFDGAPLSAGGTAPAGPLTVRIVFDEPLAADGLGPEDVVLANQLTGASVGPTAVAYDAAANAVTLDFAELPEAIYQLSLLSGDGEFEDLAGNDLDGEAGGGGPLGLPSGDGIPGGDFVATFQVDATAPIPVAPFERLRPLGSFIAASADNRGLIGAPGDVDDFVVEVQAGQILSAVVTPDNPSARLFLSLVGVAGPVFSAGPGEPVALPPELISSAGAYTLRVLGDATTTYALDVLANAAHEFEVGDSADGNELALDRTRLDLGSGRWGAVAEIAANPSLSTVYQQDFNLGAGGFVFNNSGVGSGTGLWHASTGRQADGDPGHSPAGSIYFGQGEGPLGGGNYDTGSATAGIAASPTIALPAAEVVLLSFNYLLETDGVASRDIASVEINSGAGFVTLATSADGSLDSNTSGQWESLVLDVSDHAGRNVALRFRFDSVNAAANTYEGWYVDDVRVQAANSYLVDIDEFTLDLSPYVGRAIDFAVAGNAGANLSGATVELLGPGGTSVLAVGSTSPLGGNAANFDQAILNFVPALPGTYTLRIASDEPGQYSVVATESLPLEVEPNDDVSGQLRQLDGNGSAVGHLAVGGAGRRGTSHVFTIDSSGTAEAGGSGAAYQADQFIELDVDFDALDKNDPLVRAVGTDLAMLSRSAASLATPLAIPSLSDLLQIYDDYVVIDAVADDDASQLLLDLVDLGLQYGSSFGRIVSGWLPIAAIADMGGLSSLRFAQPAYKPLTSVGQTTSQADSAMGADLARPQFGVDGSGVIVGVLSDSYDRGPGSAAADIASGDLPGSANPLGRTSTINVLSDPISGSDEGRAMLQLIHDVAPGAGLAFHTATNGQADFANGILELQSVAGANVIVDDVIYFAEPMFQDGIVAQAIDTVVANGATYFSSAGNNARSSWEGAFEPSGVTLSGRQLHDFDPGPGVDTFQSITVAPGASIRFSFQWDSPFFSVSGGAGTTSDVDFFILNSTGTTVLASGTTNNLGGDALEVVSYTNFTGSSQLNIAFGLSSGDAPGLAKWVGFGNMAVNDFPTHSATAYGHANAAGAMAVGAADYRGTPAFGVSPPQIESFSSAGGIPILFDGTGNSISQLRAKPEIVAPDGTNTTFFGSDTDGDGFPNFFGTSAAAPHAAALAALMKELAPTATPAEIYDAMMQSALDMDDPSTPGFDAGFDSGTGHGLVRAIEALTLVDVDPALVGPQVASADPVAGVTHDTSITSISLVFTEQLSAASATDSANYFLVEAGSNGVFGGGDDVTIPLTPVFDGDSAVELIVRDGATPLGFGKYRLVVEGDSSIEDVDGNPLNSTTGVGGGSDFVHEFDVVFAVPGGGDFYRVDLQAGERITLMTRTPWAGPLGDLVNTLDTRLLAYDGAGGLLAIDSDSGGDPNARLTFVAAADGPYFVQVVAESGEGEYLLDAEVEPAPAPGDFNRDGRVSGFDLTVWQATYGTSALDGSGADADFDADTDGDDFLAWQRNIVPPPRRTEPHVAAASDPATLQSEIEPLASPTSELIGSPMLESTAAPPVAVGRQLVDATIAWTVSRRPSLDHDGPDLSGNETTGELAVLRLAAFEEAFAVNRLPAERASLAPTESAEYKDVQEFEDVDAIDDVFASLLE